MRKTLLSFAVIGLVSAASAQITINSGDFGDVGEQFIFGNDATPNVNLGGTGISQVWDFRSLTTETLDTIVFTDPNTIPGATDLVNAGANLAFELDGSFLFFEKTSSAVKTVGFQGTFGLNVASVLYNPAQTLVAFPSSLGSNTSEISTFSTTQFLGIDTSFSGCQLIIDSIRINRISDFRVNFDAEGVMYLPSDTFNVLRANSVEYTTDSIFIYAPNQIICFAGLLNIPQGWSLAPALLLQTIGIQSNPTLDTLNAMTWYAQGENFGVCAIDMDGSNQQISARFKSDASQLAGLQDLNTKNGIKLFPNPADQFMTITAKTDLTGAVMAIYDLNGRLVNEVMVGQNGTISTANYINGMYMFTLRKQNEMLGGGKFAVKH